MIRYDLFAKLIESIDYPVIPYIVNNGNGNNRGVPASFNFAINRVLDDGHQNAIICNDDVEFLPGTIAQMVRDINEYEEITIGTNSIMPTRDGNNFFYPKTGLMKDTTSYPCFIAKIDKLINNVGYFDENFYPAYYEDTDMHYRIKLAGYKESINTEVGIIHHGSMTQTAFDGGLVSNDKWNSLREYYREKWGGYPEEEAWINPYNDQSKDIKYWRPVV